MKTLISLTRNAEFGRLVMSAMPWGILIVDERGHFYPVNDILRRTFGFGEEVAVDSEEDGIWVPRSPSPDSDVPPPVKEGGPRHLGLEAIRHNRPMRTQAHFVLRVNGCRQGAVVMMTALPLEYQGCRFAAVLFQDISDRERMTGTDADGFRGILGREPGMRHLFDTIRKVAPTPVPVLIQGESGTGKELVARAIHEESHRSAAHFVSFNCGALPSGLVESELFGHVKGAFTGAHRDKKGRFELANGGTIFLDEVGELTPDMQVKLLRVLQERRLERVGGEKTIELDVRVISATNRDLEADVRNGRFRDDLFYRLCVLPIDIPPLRERKGDIGILVRHFLAAFGKDIGFGGTRLTQETLTLLMNYDWPGNVRELQNVLQFAMIKAQGGLLHPRHLPPAVRQDFGHSHRIRPAAHSLNRKRVLQVLEDVGGNKKRAAEVLGVSRSTLYRFLRKTS